MSVRDSGLPKKLIVLTEDQRFILRLEDPEGSVEVIELGIEVITIARAKHAAQAMGHQVGHWRQFDGIVLTIY